MSDVKSAKMRSRELREPGTVICYQFVVYASGLTVFL